MAFSFLAWINMSAAFAGVAGAPVTVVPWGNHFALFASDAGGVVSCAGCYPQSGLMGPWAPISDAFTGRRWSALKPVTVGELSMAYMRFMLRWSSGLRRLPYCRA